MALIGRKREKGARMANRGAFPAFQVRAAGPSWMAGCRAGPDRRTTYGSKAGIYF